MIVGSTPAPNSERDSEIDSVAFSTLIPASALLPSLDKMVTIAKGAHRYRANAIIQRGMTLHRLCWEKW
jgi:hypothetical protein